MYTLDTPIFHVVCRGVSVLYPMYRPRKAELWENDVKFRKKLARKKANFLIYVGTDTG